jgi:O-antigen ligase
MAGARHEFTVGGPPLVAFVFLLAAGGGLLVTQASAGMSFGAALLALVIFVTFLNAEIGLHVILLSMLLSPEIVVGGVGGISIGKPSFKGDLLVLRIEDLILTAVSLAWLARTAIFKETGILRRTPLNAPILAYMATLILATLSGVYVGNVQPLRGFFFVLKSLEYFFVFFIAINHIREERQLFRLLTTAFATCLISAAIGISQIPSGARIGAPFEGDYGEPNTFGGYLVFMLALVLGCALCARKLPAVAGWAAFAVVVTVPLLYTLSRSSWLAVAPMLLTLIALSRRRWLLIAPLALAMVLGPMLLPDTVVKRYRYTLHEEFDRGEYRLGAARFDQSTSARFDSFAHGFTGWMEQPFFGYGVTGFSFMDAQYIRVLVEAGLFGLCAFLWLLSRILQTAWRAYQAVRGSPYEGLALGYIAGTIAMMTHAVGANTFIIVRIMEPFWFITAIIVVLSLMKANPASACGSQISAT